MVKRFRKLRSVLVSLAALILCVVMMFSFVACGAGPAGPQGAQGPAGPAGPTGPAGPAGQDGETPYIGENGNWWVGDVDTGVSAGGSTEVPEEVEELAETMVGTRSDITGMLAAKGKFYSDFTSLEDAQEVSREIAIQIAEEGMILLKNEKHALPLTSSEKHVTMLGVHSVGVMTGGGGAGSGVVGAYGVEPTTLKKGIELGGFHVNPVVDGFYNSIKPNAPAEGEGWEEDIAGLKKLASDYENAFSGYDDAALVTISRTGSEGGDLAMSGVDGNEDQHYLELTEDEKELIRFAKQNFKKVIVLINTGNIMELGELNAPKREDNLGVDAILWIGLVSNDGAAAVGPILSGEVNPSGHTADTWTYDFLDMPSSYNFSSKDENGNPLYENAMFNGSASTSYAAVEYREDIYAGYKYYETKYADMEAEEAGSGAEWYDSQVVYPFGYGLSYTDFEWELYGSTPERAEIEAANQTVTMQIKVTNIGKYPGKDVVQMYVTPPYEAYGIEKASVNLMGFAKTDILQPGESQVVTVQCVAQDFASFDWNDANVNDFYGYELEAGEYIISAKRDAHDEGIRVVRTIEEGITCPTDYTTGNEITPVFSQTEGKWAEFYSVNTSLMNNKISRADGLPMPTAATVADRTIDQTQVDTIEFRRQTYAKDDDPSDYWYVEDVPETWEQSDAAVEIERVQYMIGTHYIAKRTDPTTAKTPIQLKQMAGVPYTEYKLENGVVTVGTDEGSLLWEQFLNQLTWEEMVQIVSHDAYNRPAVDSIGMPMQNDNDGPTQLGFVVGSSHGDMMMFGLNGMTTNFPPASLMATTWNAELSYEFGKAMGNESLFINIQGWYAPSMNLHRSPFAGRNFEYLSEDGVLSGKMIAPATLGAIEKGLVTFIKHMFLNEQETDRGGVFTWATEQAMREIYLKPFEIAIKEGRANGTMASMNRIGNVRVFANGALHDGILHNEWNFKGITLTDAAFPSESTYSDSNAMLRNGVDLPLNVYSYTVAGIEVSRFDTETNMAYVTPNGMMGSWDNYQQYQDQATVASPTLYYHVRRAALHILYVTANSSGMRNGFYGDFTLDLTQGEAASGLAIPGYTYSGMRVEGTLPEGIEIASDGSISGTPTEAGTFTVTLTAVVDNQFGILRDFYYKGWSYGVPFEIDRKDIGEEATVTLVITVAPAETEN